MHERTKKVMRPPRASHIPLAAKSVNEARHLVTIAYAVYNFTSFLVARETVMHSNMNVR